MKKLDKNNMKKDTQIQKVNCIVCKKEFETTSAVKKICSDMCLGKRSYRISNREGYVENLLAGETGSIAELIISADLMKKGFEVYRPVALTTSCDLIALRKKDRAIFAIDVKSGYRNKSGKIGYSKKFKTKYVSVYIHDAKEIFYIPDFTIEIIN